MPEQVVKRGWREDPPTEDVPLAVEPTTAVGMLAEPENAADRNQVAPSAAAGTPDGAPVATATPPHRRRRGWRVLAAVGMLVVLGLVAWLAVTVDDVGDPAPRSTVAPEEAVVPDPVAFGERVTRPDRWSVQIGEPAAARPNDDIELPTGADRAVQFEITLTNNTDQPRGSAGWILKATADSRPVELLPPDTATAPSRTILPGESLRFTVAVPMPAQENVDLLVEAGPAGSSPSLFVGQA